MILNKIDGISGLAEADMSSIFSSIYSSYLGRGNVDSKFSFSIYIFILGKQELKSCRAYYFLHKND